jgi:PadR family transcriptional regulator, regulatory protein PadR
MTKEMIRGHLDMLVLSIVARGASHGYAIAEQLRLASGGQFELAEGTLYPALYRLEGDGWLTSEWAAAEGRRRRIYKITQPGRRELARKHKEWSSFNAAVAGVIRAKLA